MFARKNKLEQLEQLEQSINRAITSIDKIESSQPAPIKVQMREIVDKHQQAFMPLIKEMDLNYQDFLNRLNEFWQPIIEIPELMDGSYYSAKTDSFIRGNSIRFLTADQIDPTKIRIQWCQQKHEVLLEELLEKLSNSNQFKPEDFQIIEAYFKSEIAAINRASIEPTDNLFFTLLQEQQHSLEENKSKDLLKQQAILQKSILILQSDKEWVNEEVKEYKESLLKQLHGQTMSAPQSEAYRQCMIKFLSEDHELTSQSYHTAVSKAEKPGQKIGSSSNFPDNISDQIKNFLSVLDEKEKIDALIFKITQNNLKYSHIAPITENAVILNSDTPSNRVIAPETVKVQTVKPLVFSTLPNQDRIMAQISAEQILNEIFAMKYPTETQTTTHNPYARQFLQEKEQKMASYSAILACLPTITANADILVFSVGSAVPSEGDRAAETFQQCPEFAKQAAKTGKKVVVINLDFFKETGLDAKLSGENLDVYKFNIHVSESDTLAQVFGEVFKAHLDKNENTKIVFANFTDPNIAKMLCANGAFSYLANNFVPDRIKVISSYFTHSPAILYDAIMVAELKKRGESYTDYISEIFKPGWKRPASVYQKVPVRQVVKHISKISAEKLQLVSETRPGKKPSLS